MAEADTLVRQLADGFAALQQEYQKLFGQQQTLERKLATAREQYNELAKLYGSGTTTTPPLSLSSSPTPNQDTLASLTVPEILEQHRDSSSQDSALKVRNGLDAALALKDGLPVPDFSTDGVRIWAGPAADKPDKANSFMPSISESPLEQDFTIEGRPSSLGCPFASMAKKKLSSHAASVLSRYNQSSVGAQSSSNASVNRVNGRESFHRRASRRASFADPIRAEICGLSEHNEPLGSSDDVVEIAPAEPAEQALNDPAEDENAEPGVCPIRFLDQHSPEEVATYFEKHKHELPRSHEICVKRYQSNEQQIRELDNKYGNLVSMIQGLGAKHKDMLPDEPDPDEEENSNVVDDAKVRKWANSVSREGNPAAEDADESERQPRFERPLREVRVGESPSRPWGISVPPKYYEKPENVVNSGPASAAAVEEEAVQPELPSKRPAGKCPFGFDQGGPKPSTMKEPQESKPTLDLGTGRPTFISDLPGVKTDNVPATSEKQAQPQRPPMIFNGPVFIGYSADEAAKILQASGFGTATS